MRAAGRVQAIKDLPQTQEYSRAPTEAAHGCQSTRGSWTLWSMFCGLTLQTRTSFWRALSWEGYFEPRTPASPGLRFRRMPRSVQLSAPRRASWRGPELALSVRTTTALPGRLFRRPPPRYVAWLRTGEMSSLVLIRATC